MILWIRRWGPAILMMMLIFAASATPSQDLPELGFLDLFVYKGGHMLGYALLAAAFLHGLAAGKIIHRWHLILAVVLAVFYAATDEGHQAFTAGRNPAPGDVMIDALGALVGLAVWSRIRPPLLRQRESAPGEKKIPQ